MIKQIKMAMSAVGVLTVAFAIQASEGHAATVTHGNLTSDDTTNIIEDTSNNRRYTRLDAFDLTVAQTEAAIASGGAYEGWSIATSTVADEFIAALLGVASTPCNGGSSATVCGAVAGWTDGDFGESYVNYLDYFAYYNTEGGSPIGLVEIRDYSVNQIRDFSSWSTGSYLNAFGGGGYYSQNPINLMLYQDVTAVPVPAAGLLLLTGLGGMGLMRRRRKAA